MDSKYYTGLVFDAIEDAVQFAKMDVPETSVTQYLYPVVTTTEGKVFVVVLDINQLPEEAISEVKILKVNDNQFT
ncbi:MAG: hypothetical protein F9K23_15825 [Bacteroidetes bacterium]|nr:MAG: hypothetical protein F9K23_15825 [Bacteroidota bacterium]